MIGAGVLLFATALQSFSVTDDKGKMKRYEVIRHENGQTIEFDTLIPMSSDYTVEQFLANKGISSENVKIVQMSSAAEGNMVFVNGEEGGEQHIVVREILHDEEINWSGEDGKEVKITCEMGPDGKMVTRKTVDGKEVELSETEIHELENGNGNSGERKIVVRTEAGDHVNGKNPEGEQMQVKIKCEIDENGNVQARKWVNGEEVELTEDELAELQAPREDGQKVIIRMERNSEGVEPTEEQIIEIEQILEELGAGEDGEHKMIFIEQEIDNGNGEERHVIQIDGEEPVEWTEGSQSQVRVINSDETEFTVVFVTENINPSSLKSPKAEHKSKSHEVSIYPNPSSGLVTIEFANSEKVKTTVKIADLNGKIVFSEELGKFSGTYRKEVDLNSFGRGSYLVTIQQGKETVSEKIIVE